MPDPTYLLYDPDDGWQSYDTLTAAEDAFGFVVESMTRDASDDGGWHDGVESVALYRAERVRGVRLVPTGDEPRDGFDEALVLEVVEDPPAADPALLAAANRALVEEVERLRAARDAALAEQADDDAEWEAIQAMPREVLCAELRAEGIDPEIANSSILATVAQVHRIVGERDSARALARTLLLCARSGDVIPQDLPEWLEAP